jgi:4-amino-4-deoxy-L-arabinose transferase-like glycosyltransferase
LFSVILLGDLNPHFFNYGSLYLYLVTLAVLLLHPGASLTAWGQQILSGQAEPLLRSWTLEARIVSLVASLATVYVVYLLGWRLAGRTVALTAAALVALAPLASLTARYGTVDPTQALFLCLALYFSVLLFTRPTVRTALGAGVCAGLAASTKYNGMVVLVAPLLAVVLAPGAVPAASAALGRGKRKRRAGETPALPGRGAARVRALQCLAILAGAVLAFSLTSPYTFLAWGEARQGILFEFQHARGGEQLAVLADPSGFLFHLKHLLAPGLGLPVLLAVVGTVWVLARRRREWYPLVLFAALWFVMIGLAQTRYPRYELPLIAPLALLAAAPLAELTRGRWAYQAALALGALLALFWCGQLALGLQGPRPQDQALAYLLAHSRPRDTVGFTEAPWFADPPVDYCNGGEGIGSTPLWRGYRREARPVYADARLPIGFRLPWFVTTDFSVNDAVRAGDLDKTNLLLGVARTYRTALSVGGVPLALVPWPLGPDWRYPWPRIDVWQYKQ